MEAEENTPRLEQLLSKRRQLIDLRKKITSQLHSQEATTDNYNPGTPYSDAQPSISPPPFSPLTPLIFENNNGNNNLQGHSGHRSSPFQTTDLMRPLSSPSLLTTTPNNDTGLESPLLPMSPETQKLFDVLNEDEIMDDINEEFFVSKQDEQDYCDSDDSVKDPNYTIHDEGDETRSHLSFVCSNVDEEEDSHKDEEKTREQDSNKGREETREDDSNKDGKETREQDSNKHREKTREEDSNKDGEEIREEDSDKDEEDIRSSLITGRPKRGRKRINPQLRSERKHNKYHNLEYRTTKNKIIKPKVFKNYQCTCLKNCNSLISVEKRKEEFEKFIQLGSYNAQLLYLGSCIKEVNKKRSYTMTNVPAEKKKPKQYNRIYSINGVKVCRDMFLKTFQITTQKVTTSLVKLRKGGLLNDGRGMNTGGMNKLPDEEHNFITDIIGKLPKYESHYRREKNSGTLYLQPGMTLPNIYDIYQQEYIKKFGEERKCASLASVKKIFYSKFNLKCKPLKKDTCNKCDMLNVKIQNAKNREETEEAQKEKNLHLERAENLRNKMNSDFKTAQDLPTVECLTFDMEKTLPLPRIPTNVVFYKRQLWLYNSGIHSASDDTGHCYVWVEGEAGRGAQEVGSCLLKYIETKLSPTVEHLILWSDCCGGQNRNIKIVLMLKAILNSHETLKTVTFRFLESGHTFLPNDTDFSKIETALKHQQRIFTAEEYVDIIKNCKKRKPLQVHRMKKTDFYSTQKLEKNITNRKKFTDKSKVNWIQTKEIKVTSNRKFSLFMKSSLEEDYKELDIGKKVKGEELNINKSDFTLLWPDGKPIAPAKLNDLESMYQYIPEDCLQFYKTLKSSENITDDVDGFGGEPDFDLQEEREDD